jgi:hypothetical protein
VYRPGTPFPAGTFFFSWQMLRFNAEQLWQNLTRQGWQRVPPQW